MATKVSTPCAEPGCAWVGDKTRCPDHRRKDRRDSWKRWGDGKSSDPFYGKKAWRKASSSYRTKHPLCERCEAQGKTTEADLVHHIEPWQDGGAKYDPNNLRSLCESCHRKVHDPRYVTETTLVCGPSGAGKSSWVRARRKPGDLVIDVDLLFQALGMLPAYEKPDTLLDPVLTTRDHMLDYIAGPNSTDRAWVIASSPSSGERDELAQRIDADEVVVLKVEPEECRRRIMNDDNRPEHLKRGYVNLSRRWWDQYSRRDGDRIEGVT